MGMRSISRSTAIRARQHWDSSFITLLNELHELPWQPLPLAGAGAQQIFRRFGHGITCWDIACGPPEPSKIGSSPITVGEPNVDSLGVELYPAQMEVNCA